MKAYEKHVASLDDLGIKMSWSNDDKVVELVGEVEGKVEAMEGVIKGYKKTAFKGEQEFKKDRQLIIGILVLLDVH